MAKFFEIDEQNRELIDGIFQETGMHNYINLIILGVPKMNGKVISIAKTNPIAEKLGNCPDSVVCTVYEEAFDRLDENAKRLIVTDALATISYDTEKDKIIVGCPQIVVTAAGRARFGEDLLNACEAGLFAIAQIEQEKKEEAERLKAKKANKK